MKFLLLLLGWSAVSGQNQAPSTGLYFSLNEKIYENGDIIFINEIGRADGNNPGSSLICMTENVNRLCCRSRDGGHSRGDWLFPNRSMILNTKNLNFYRTRYIRQVRLNRNNDAMSPTGVFTCEVPDALASRITHSASVTILASGVCNNCDNNAVCTQIDGNFTCTCNQGYTGDGVNCTDINECTSGVNNCDTTDATCTNTHGSFTCACNQGYTGDGVTCEDIDECMDGMCSLNAICTNEPGSFSCTCNEGYTGDGVTSCEDIDECTDGIDNCDSKAMCSNRDGSFTCTCDKGYTGDGVTCDDIDECAVDFDNCDTNANCTNTPGSFTCTCNPGYTGNGVTCTVSPPSILTNPEENIGIEFGSSVTFSITADGIRLAYQWKRGDDSPLPTNNSRFQGVNTRSLTILNVQLSDAGSYICVVSNLAGRAVSTEVKITITSDNCNCDNNATCTHINGNFTCICNQGYTGDGVNCTDINECTSGINNCDITDATCTNTHGSFTCTCNQGYSGDGVICRDIDECMASVDDCKNTAFCTNTPGSFTCTCNPGYTGDGVISCDDIDECVVPERCDAHAVCTNNIGSFTCTCHQGYTGDGITCEDIDECMNGMCSLKAICTNGPGSFSCTCNEGYTGDGVTSCEDIDECTDGIDNCDSKAMCSNRDGSFTCTCDKGYTGDGVTCDDIDECATGFDNCDTNANCTNTPGSFNCTCNPGYTGDGVTCTVSPPSILMNPEENIGITLGSNITFSITADGIRLAYQWKRGDDLPLLTNNSRFQGVTTRSLTILNVQLSDTGSYICVVSNTAGRVVSTEVMLTVSKIDAVDSINVTTVITSAVVSWSPSTEPQLLTYELQYFPTLFPYSISTLNTTFTSHEVTGLIPRFHYRFQVRVYTSVGHGGWSETDVRLEQGIPAVSNLSAVVMSGPSIIISWSPSVLLPGWNISYYYLSYSVLLPFEAKPRAMFMSTVKGSQTSEVVEADRLVVKPDVLHMFEVSVVLKINGLEGIGEVRGEKTSTNTIMEYEKLPFQVMIGPIDYCIHWNKEKASSIRAVIRRSLVQAISARCACDFSEDSISSGYFSCRNSKTSVIYRSTITGLNATELIGYIQNWVDSSTTLLLDWFYVDVYNICPVKISKLDESDCQLTDSKLLSTPPTLTKSNSEVIECINTCLIPMNGTDKV